MRARGGAVEVLPECPLYPRLSQAFCHCHPYYCVHIPGALGFLGDHMRFALTWCLFTVNPCTGRSNFTVQSSGEALLSVRAGLILVWWPLPKVSLPVYTERHYALYGTSCLYSSVPSLRGSALHVCTRDPQRWWGKQASLPNSIQAIKNSFHFYLWGGLSALRTANRRKAYD